MILQALYELAQNEGLMADPDYEPKAVAWLVRIGPDGTLLGIEGTHHISPEEEKKKKPKRLPKNFSVPREGGRTSGDRAFFLYDKAEYVFGLDSEKIETEKRPKEKLLSRASLFRERVKQCLEATRDEGVQAVFLFLDGLAAGRQTVSLPDECASNDLFAFVYAPDVDRLVTDREKVRAYWKGLRGVKVSGGGDQKQCLVAGDNFSGKVGNFPSAKKVPGGSTSGVALVSFNSKAFESYGWAGNENAPISRDAAEACSTALNRLLHPTYPSPHQTGQSLPKQHLRLSADTVVCFWSAKAGDEFCSIMGGLLEANPDEVKELYRSIWRGKPPEIEDVSAFYALTLTGTQGRAIVRDWFESTVKKVAGNLAVHFSDLEIVRNTPKPRERELPPQIPLSALLKSLAVRGDSESIPAHMAAQMVESALCGTPYPFSILQRALERARAEIGGKEWSDMDRRDARAALIKAVLNRRKRFFPATTHYEEVLKDMDPNNASEGYVLGRLMAVLERIQQEALNDVNASVVDRFFSGASATPKCVFVRLLKNARHHVRKAKDDQAKGGLVFLLDKLLDELSSRFDPKNNGFPAHLDLEQQGLFVLGYHQMRKWLWMTKEERSQWETQHTEAPRAYRWSSAK